MRFDHLVGQELARGSFTWDADRALLYAVGVGAGSEDPLDELQFTTENTLGVDQQVIPTFLTQMSVKSDWINRLGFRTKQWNGKDYGFPDGLVHGEQSVTLHRPIPPSGSVDLSQVLVGVYDKGSGALVVSETRARLAATGEPLGTSRMGLFVRGQGGFAGSTAPEGAAVWIEPERAPDLVVSIKVAPAQSLIFRLLGDRAAHGSDPARAQAEGFDRPIFFGLGTYGVVCRALLKGCCDGDVGRFGGIEGRFSRPVYPGDRLDTLIWQDADGARFRTMANGECVVFDRGMFRHAGAGSS